MKSREKLLAIGVGAVVLLFAARYLHGVFVTGPVADLEKQRASAEAKVEKTNKKVLAARAARMDVEELARHGLPANPIVAQERFQAYLVHLLASAGIASPTIMPGQPTQREGITVVPFSLTADATIEAFTKFLYSFYSSPRLQQIKRLTLNPIERADMAPSIRFSLSMEALGFGEGNLAETESTVAGTRVGTDPAAYRAVIERNVLFARGPGGAVLPANSPEHVVLTAIMHDQGKPEADVYDRARNKTRQVALGQDVAIGPGSGRVVDMGFRDLVVDIEGQLWQWRLGQTFSQRVLLTPEQLLDREMEKRRLAVAP